MTDDAIFPLDSKAAASNFLKPVVDASMLEIDGDLFIQFS